MDERKIERFKRSFWGEDSVIQVVGEEGNIHKIRFLKTKTAKFLEGCDISIYGIPVKFDEAIIPLSDGSTQSASGFNIKDGRPHYDGCYSRSSSENTSAINALYYAYQGVRHRKWMQSLQKTHR